jgi:YVTN family beta-propeller protein
VPERRAGTVTFLFTDVEGSTRLVRQLRDRYPGVLADHRRLVRAAFAQHGGEEVDTQGDAFFYVFSRARDAAAAAADAQRALQAHAWPEDAELRVRMGLHTGEPVVSEEGYHGLGVHRAARIMAAGHGGQILASQATAAMLADDELPGVEERDLGEFRLKDLDHPEHVYQLDVEGLPAMFPPLRTGDAPTAYAGKEEELVEAAAGARRPLYRRPLVIGALAGVLAAAVAIPVFALGRGSAGHGELERLQDGAVAVVDAKSRAIDEASAIASPQRVAAGEGGIWVTSSSGGGSVMRLDPKSHEVIDTIPVGSGPVGIAVGAGAVWVANTLAGTVSRIDAATRRVVQTIDVGNTPTAVAFGAGAVWVTNVVDRSVSKIDPVAGAVVRRIDVEAAAGGIAVGDGAVWVTDPVGNELVRYDMRSATPERIRVGSGPTAVAYGNGAVWVTNSLDGTVSLIDARRATMTYTIPVGAAPNGVAADLDGAWVTNEVGGTLVHLDQASRETTSTTLGGRPEGVTLANGSLWIAVQATGAAHRGGTLRLVAESGSGFDPARGYDLYSSRLLPVVYDGLVGFKRVGGTDGNTLVPDLATALPAPTRNGRTYTFRLRKGIKFSDGRELKASAVRYTFERMFRAHITPTGFYEGIVGGPACGKQPKRCNLSKGVLANDGRGIVTIRLRAPDPDFLYKLALSYAFVVPTGTPATGKGAVLGTGPYRIAEEYNPKRRVRLVRNRHFRLWSKAAQPEGIPDEIMLELAGTTNAQVTAVKRGREDYLLDFPSNRLQAARTRYASQLHITPKAETSFVVLNTKRPPFDDERARRAVAYALDRGRLVEVSGGNDVAAPTCQLLPPNFPGYQRYCPYTVHPTEGGAWTAPDLQRARKLVAASGTTGMRVDVIGTSGTNALSALTTSLVQTLRRLGYSTSVKRQPVTRYFSGSPGSGFWSASGRVEAAVSGWSTDYPAPSDFMISNLACSHELAGYFCDPVLDRKFRKTAELQSRNPQAANEAWARLDREVVDRAIIVPVITPQAADFVSKRVKNYQRHPVFGMLVGQVWVR